MNETDQMPVNLRGEIADVNFQLPANLEAERMSLGCILLDNGVASQALYELEPADYFLPRHRYVFEAFRALDRKGRGIDYLTLQEELELSGHAQECNPAFIAALIDGCPRFSVITEFVRQIKEASTRRKAIRMAQWLTVTAAAKDIDLPSLLSQLTDKVAELEQSKIVDDLITSERAVERTFQQLQEQWDAQSLVIGLPTGLVDLDYRLKGIRRGKYIVIAATTGMGKTTLALNWADNFVLTAPEGEKPVGLIISLEMSVEELHIKLLSVRTRIDSERIETGQLRDHERAALRRAASDLACVPIDYVEGFSAVTASSILARVEKIKRKYGRINFLIVDYLQLLDADHKGDSEHVRLTEISRTLKRISVRYNIPVIVLSQLNRQWAQRANKDPELSDLRGSGSIEQDADVVIFIAPEDYSDPDNPGRRLLSRKVRGGKPGIDRAVFFGAQSRFENAARDFERQQAPAIRKAHDSRFNDYQSTLDETEWRDS